MRNETADTIRRYAKLTYPAAHPSKKKSLQEYYQELKGAWLALNRRERTLLKEHMRANIAGT